jgi:AraC-like DNA-binding protein
VLRGLIFEVIHFAMKRNPSESKGSQKQTVLLRIDTLFIELLERQSPVDENHPNVQFRSASEFANQLIEHENHLNRAVKEVNEKQLLRLLANGFFRNLKHSDWNISKIAFVLGFKEVSHFNNFFKKHMGLSPSKFRNT